MKKIIFIIFALALLLISCSNSNSDTSSSGKKYVISGSTGKTTYTVDAATGKISESVSINNSGETTTRSYSYNSTNELSEINSENSVYGSRVVTYSTESNRADNHITKKITTVTTSRGDEDASESQYIYDDDGKAKGVIRTDSRNNKWAKGSSK